MLKTPHPASVPNLRKITDYMVSNNFVTPANTTSAYSVAQATGISYNQALNLMKKPGFVQVWEHKSARPTFFYAFAQLGMQYPDRFPPDVRLPRQIIEDAITSTATSNQEVNAEVSRVQASGTNHVTVRDVLDFSNVKLADTLTLKPADLGQTMVNAMIAAAQKKRTPEQIAALTYAMAEKFRDGKFTLEES